MEENIDDDEINTILDWDESEWENDDEDLEEAASDILCGKLAYNDFIKQKIEENDPKMKELFTPHPKVKTDDEPNKSPEVEDKSDDEPNMSPEVEHKTDDETKQSFEVEEKTVDELNKSTEVVKLMDMTNLPTKPLVSGNPPQKKRKKVEPANSSAKKKKILKPVYEWKKTQFQEPDTEWKPSLPPPPEEEFTPLEYFKMFIPEKIIKLICDQINIYAHEKTGTTIRSDRMGSCPLKSHEELQVKGRGAIDWKVEANSGIAVVRWLDRKALQMISSYCCVQPTDTCMRYSREERKHIEVVRPRIVQQYNQFMGGVDLVDMLVELYRIDIRSNKWYTRIIFWCLNVAVVTAWQMYRRHENQRKKKKQEIMPLIQFQSRIAKALTIGNHMQEKKRGRPSQENIEAKRRCSTETQPEAEVRFDQLGHFPNYSDNKKRCKLCKVGVTVVFCTKCNIHLCFVPKSKNCFHTYHCK